MRVSLETTTVPGLATLEERGKKKYWANNICTNTSSLTLSRWPENHKWTTAFHEELKYLVWKISSKGVKIFWVGVICINTCSLTLTFDHVTWKSIEIIYSLGTTTILSLATFEQSGQKILGEHGLVYRLPAWPTDLTTGAKQYPFQRGTTPTPELSHFHKIIFYTGTIGHSTTNKLKRCIYQQLFW